MGRVAVVALGLLVVGFPDAGDCWSWGLGHVDADVVVVLGGFDDWDPLLVEGGKS